MSKFEISVRLAGVYSVPIEAESLHEALVKAETLAARMSVTELAPHHEHSDDPELICAYADGVCLWTLDEDFPEALTGV